MSGAGTGVDRDPKSEENGADARAWATSGGHVDLTPAVAAPDAGSAIDRFLVGERVSRYGWAYDERDREALGDCFTADSVFSGSLLGSPSIEPVEGRDEVIKFLVGSWARLDDQRRHVFTNCLVDLYGDTAIAHAYLLLFASTEAEIAPQTVGPYRIELARDGADGVWRITRMAAGFDHPY